MKKNISNIVEMFNFKLFSSKLFFNELFISFEHSEGNDMNEMSM